MLESGIIAEDQMDHPAEPIVANMSVYKVGGIAGYTTNWVN